MKLKQLIIGVSIFSLSILFLSASGAFSEEKTEGIDLTVYNQNFGVVRDSRFIDLKKGMASVNIEDVAASIDPTSVTIKSLNNPDSFKVLEQNYQYDLVNKFKLLEKYIGKEIAVGAGTGRLLSSDGVNIIMEIDGRIKIMTPGADSYEISLPQLPEGLILKPTLNWLVEANKDGKELTEISYITSDINWKADYNAVADENDKFLNLTGWVTLDNQSGASYKNASLKLIAGDVKLISPQVNKRSLMMSGAMAEDRGGQSFAEKSFFEYHMYTLAKPTTIKDRETKQIEFISASRIPVNKVYVYDGFMAGPYMYDYDYNNSYGIREDSRFGTEINKKVEVAFEFINKKDNNLGIPLPKGKLRIYKQNSDGALEFIGEDLIDHTPKDEKMYVQIGNAFDITGDRKQTNFETVVSGHTYEESFEITVKNHKNEDIEVRIPEHLYRGSDWIIIVSELPYTKKDSKTIEFLLKVPKTSEKTITYTVRYNW